MQSFSLASLTPDKSSASSVLAAPHSLLKLSGRTEEQSRNIMLNATSSESDWIAQSGERRATAARMYLGSLAFFLDSYLF